MADTQHPEPTQVELDAFILRAGFRVGWENLESWARRMSEQAVREINEARAIRAAQPSGEYPADPEGVAFIVEYGGDVFTLDQMRAYADATCAMRAAQPASGLDPELGPMLDFANAGEIAFYDYAVAQHCRATLDILDGKDHGAGACNEPWASVRKRLLSIVELHQSATQWGFVPAEAQQPGADPVALPYKQALGSTNCMQCCVSYMMGLPLENVPDFATDGGWELFSGFVESKGYAAVMLPGNHEFEADYLASGTTERGTPHMVVMNDGKLVHDPHPSNAGLVEVQCVWLLTKKATPQGHHDEHAAFEASAKAYTSNVSFERDEHDYADMTASLLWHGWKLRAARAPADSVTAPAGGANWQDISTAPKDGTRFVAVGQNYGLDSEAQHTCMAQWFRGCWIEVSEWNEISELKYLTHWMPLPPLPGSAARKQGDA